MTVRKEDMRPGLVLQMRDPDIDDVFEVFIVGKDPKGNWVGYCEDWALELSQLDDEDYEYMWVSQ